MKYLIVFFLIFFSSMAKIDKNKEKEAWPEGGKLLRSRAYPINSTETKYPVYSEIDGYYTTGDTITEKDEKMNFMVEWEMKCVLALETQKKFIASIICG